MDYADIAVAVLAAGQSKRFGGDKLRADLHGQPLGLCAAQMLVKLGFGWRFAICGPTLAVPFALIGYEPIINHTPELGQSRSLHLAFAAAQKTSADFLMICLADMPCVSADHIVAIIEKAAHHDGVVASSNGHNAMPPAIFPRSIWPVILETTGDAGARSFLKSAMLVHASPETLIDIDTPVDLAAARAAL